MWIEWVVPTVQGFLHVFPLRFGALVCFFWTLIRAIICTTFFTEAILEVFANKSWVFGRVLVNSTQVAYTARLWAPIYYTYILMLLVEGVVIVCCFHLLVGFLLASRRSLQIFLTMRRLLWATEEVCLIALCVLHNLLLGWYLAMVMFILLELYAIMVVYSFFMDVQLKEEIKAKKKKCCSTT